MERLSRLMTTSLRNCLMTSPTSGRSLAARKAPAKKAAESKDSDDDKE